MLEHNNDNFQIYPTHRVVSFFDNKTNADIAIAGLVDAGFKSNVVDESIGEDGLDFIDPDAKNHGLLAKVIRTWHKLGNGEEKAYVENVKKELKAGHVLVSVPVVNEEECHKSADIFRNNSGNHIRYYGIFHVENLD